MTNELFIFFSIYLGSLFSQGNGRIFPILFFYFLSLWITKELIKKYKRRNNISFLKLRLKSNLLELSNLSVPENLLPIIAQNYNWNFMLPFGRKEDADLLNFMGSSMADLNSTENTKNNIWRNIINKRIILFFIKRSIIIFYFIISKSYFFISF